MILSNAVISPILQLQTWQMMTSQIRSHTMFSTDLLYSCTHFLIEIDEKSSHKGRFKYDLMLLVRVITFLATLICLIYG